MKKKDKQNGVMTIKKCDSGYVIPADDTVLAHAMSVQ